MTQGGEEWTKGIVCPHKSRPQKQKQALSIQPLKRELGSTRPPPPWYIHYHHFSKIALAAVWRHVAQPLMLTMCVRCSNSVSCSLKHNHQFPFSLPPSFTPEALISRYAINFTLCLFTPFVLLSTFLLLLFYLPRRKSIHSIWQPAGLWSVWAKRALFCSWHQWSTLVVLWVGEFEYNWHVGLGFIHKVCHFNFLSSSFSLFLQRNLWVHLTLTYCCTSKNSSALHFKSSSRSSASVRLLITWPFKDSLRIFF